MYTSKEILAAASSKYGKKFSTLREVEIHLSKLEAETDGEEISVMDAIRLSIGVGLPMNYADLALCIDKHVQAEVEAMRVKMLQTRTARNNLFVPQSRGPVRIERYVDGVLTEILEV
jgi:hypothetical protein